MYTLRTISSGNTFDLGEVQNHSRSSIYTLGETTYQRINVWRTLPLSDHAPAHCTMTSSGTHVENVYKHIKFYKQKIKSIYDCLKVR